MSGVPCGTGGVFVAYRKPYLCGLSSGRGEGAGMVGDRFSNNSSSGSGSSMRGNSVLESFRSLSDDVKSRIVVEGLSGMFARPSVMVTVEVECTTLPPGERPG